MGLYITVNGLLIRDKDKGNKHGLMGHIMKLNFFLKYKTNNFFFFFYRVLGKITKLLVRGNSIFLREINMKEIFLIIMYK